MKLLLYLYVYIVTLFNSVLNIRDVVAKYKSYLVLEKIFNASIIEFNPSIIPIINAKSNPKEISRNNAKQMSTRDAKELSASVPTIPNINPPLSPKLNTVTKPSFREPTFLKKSESNLTKVVKQLINNTSLDNITTSSPDLNVNENSGVNHLENKKTSLSDSNLNEKQEVNDSGSENKDTSLSDLNVNEKLQASHSGLENEDTSLSDLNVNKKLEVSNSGLENKNPSSWTDLNVNEKLQVINSTSINKMITLPVSNNIPPSNTTLKGVTKTTSSYNEMDTKNPGSEDKTLTSSKENMKTSKIYLKDVEDLKRTSLVRKIASVLQKNNTSLNINIYNQTKVSNASKSLRRKSEADIDNLVGKLNGGNEKEELLYAPFWKGGEYVFLRTGTLQVSFYEHQIDQYRDCDRVCSLFEDVWYGKICACRRDQHWTELIYRNFSSLCAMEENNCSRSHLRWYPLHRGICDYDPHPRSYIQTFDQRYEGRTHRFFSRANYYEGAYEHLYQYKNAHK